MNSLTAIVVALALLLAPAPRCTQGALLVIRTEPPTYAQCKAGKWWAISERSFILLSEAQKRVKR